MSTKAILLTLISSLSFLSIKAQEIHFVEIGINGLHCSACTFSVEKSIKKLDFVSVIQMDLNDRSGKVYFKEHKSANYKLLAKAVFDAGFSVRYFDVVFRDKLDDKINCVENEFCIVDNKLDQQKRLRIIGKHFQEKKAFKESEELLKNNCEECSESDRRLKVILI